MVLGLSTKKNHFTASFRSDFNYNLKVGEDILFKTAKIKKINDYRYEITFEEDYFLGVPENKPLFFIKKLEFEFDLNKTYSSKDVQNEFKPEDLRSNIKGKSFIADDYFIKKIGQIIRNDREGVRNINYLTFKLTNNFWIFNYKTRSFQEGKYYDFKSGKIFSIFRSGISPKLSILKCIIKEENVQRAGLYDTIFKKGIIGKDFNWEKYNEIKNSYGSIKRIPESKSWYLISFSNQCRKVLNLSEKFLPKNILFCLSPLYKNKKSSIEFSELNSIMDIHHPIANTNVRLIDANSIGKALSMVFHGTSLNGPKNENYKYLNLENVFWLQIYNNKEEVAYLDLEFGVVNIVDKEKLKNIRLSVYTYKIY